MLIYIKKQELNQKIEVKDSDDNLLCYLIYDFAYKRRLRIFDGLDNEVGYIKLKIETLNNDIVLCDKQDDILDKYCETNVQKFDDDKYKLIKNNKEIGIVFDKTDLYEIEVLDEDSILYVIFDVIIIIDKTKLAVID